MTKYLLLPLSLLPLSLYAFDDYRCSDVMLHNENTAVEQSNAFDTALSKGKIEGHIRLAHIYQISDTTGIQDSYATSVGGELKYQTATYYNFSAAISTFISQKINPLSGDFDKGNLNTDFFDADGSSYAYIGEAYLDYKKEKFHLRLGRQKLDTPLNDRDDIRMNTNTFEALTIGYGGIDHFVFVAGYINRWAGFDSGDDKSKFKDFPGNIEATNENGKGAAMFGVQNDSFDGMELQAWYYSFDKAANVFYTDVSYEMQYDKNFTLGAALQYAHYDERSASNIDGDVAGIQATLGFDPLNIGVSYNSVDTADNKKIVIGYGGGPYFTSMEEMTIDRINDAKAYVVSLQSEFNDLSLAYAYGNFKGKDGSNDVKYVENDLIAAYRFDEQLDLELSYAEVNDKTRSGSSDTGYDRVLFRMNYYF